MRTLVAALAVMALLVVGSPAVAGVGDLVNGVNGIVTSPLDSAHGLLEPVRVLDMGDVYSKLEKANVVTDRISGVALGLFTTGNRALRGAGDIVTFPVTKYIPGGFSLPARYEAIHGK